MEFDHRYEIAGESPLIMVCSYCESDFVYYNRSVDVWPEKCPICKRLGFWRKNMEPLDTALMRVIKNLIDEEVQLKDVQHHVKYDVQENYITLKWHNNKFKLSVEFVDDEPEDTDWQSFDANMEHRVDIHCEADLHDLCADKSHFVAKS